MLKLLVHKSASGDLSVNLAQSLMESHEWGLALKNLNEGLKKGGLSDPERAQQLFHDLCQRLGIKEHEFEATNLTGRINQC
jgi:hypothetical protein